MHLARLNYHFAVVLIAKYDVEVIFGLGSQEVASCAFFYYYFPSRDYEVITLHIFHFENRHTAGLWKAAYVVV